MKISLIWTCSQTFRTLSYWDNLLLFCSSSDFQCSTLYIATKVLVLNDRLWKDWRVVHRVTTSDNEWHRVVQGVTTNGSEWQRVVQRVTTNDNDWQQMTTSDNKWYNEWQRVTTNGNGWQQVRAVVQRMKMAQYTSKNGWLPSFQWQKEIHYYFKGWMAAIRVVK